MDDSLKSNLSQIRVIGEKLHRLEDRLPKFRQHLSDLEAGHKRVSGAYEEMLTQHGDTFLAVSRNIEMDEERRLRAREMEARQPIKNAKYSQHLNSHPETRKMNQNRSSGHHVHYSARDRAEMNSELPSFVSSKYKTRRAMNVEEAKLERYLHEATHPRDMAWMEPISRSAALFSGDSVKKAILDSINMAWTMDRFRDVEDRQNMKRAGHD